MYFFLKKIKANKLYICLASDHLKENEKEKKNRRKLRKNENKKDLNSINHFMCYFKLISLI